MNPHPVEQLSLFRPTLHPVRVDVGTDAEGKKVIRPLDKAWQKRRPSADDLREHLERGGDFGYIPASLEAIVIDIDEGEPGPVVDLAGQPLAITTSWSGRGQHLAYNLPLGWQSPTGYGKGKLQLEGIRGDWLHDRAFSLETLAGWHVLAEADYLAPSVDMAALDTLIQPRRRGKPDRVPAKREQRLRIAGDGFLGRGTRWLGLRYRLNRDTARIVAAQAFDRHTLIEHAYALNRQFCRPSLPTDQVTRLARDTADYWTLRMRNGDSAIWLARQAWRGRRGGMASGESRRRAVAKRDAAILADRMAGLSYRALGRRYGLSLGGVQHVLRRDLRAN